MRAGERRETGDELDTEEDEEEMNPGRLPASIWKDRVEPGNLEIH